MQENDSQIRRQIFYEELKKLKEKKYLDEKDYVKVYYAYKAFTEGEDVPKTETVLEKEKPLPTLNLHKETEELVVEKTPKLIPPPKPKAKKVLSPDQIRERNIAWSLILGVILLFIGGLVFGTSNWSSMGNLFKVVLVSMVSIVFFACSFIAEKYLKIHKTAFAFMTLGSLFLPISILSIGFFELFGTWLSIYGEGKYPLGFFGSILCLTLYFYIASKYKHRLFVWFSFLTATIGIGFLLAMTHLPRDFFYLGMMVYNALLLVGYYRLKNGPKWALFIKELPVYSQLNLIVSTLLMLFFFENETFYSFNVLLTAVLYMAMVFVHNVKQYHYLFTFLFVYGMYQLIEHSFLHSIDFIGYAMIGSFYLIFHQYAKSEGHLKKVFQITSAIISFCAFIFISLQGVLLRYEEDSIVLFLAYVIIAINYICLANLAKLSIFRYLAPIFLMVAGFQSYFLIFKETVEFLEIYVFTIATFMYVLLYLKNQFKYVTEIKNSSFIVSIATMGLMIFSALGTMKWTHGAILFLAFGGISLLTYFHSNNIQVKKVASWVNPISWGLACLSFYNEVEQIEAYRINVDVAGHFAISGLLLLAISYLWKKRSQPVFDFSTFMVAVSLYTLGILTSFVEVYSQHPYLNSLIYFIGISIYLLLVYRAKKEPLWITVSVTTLLFLTSLASVFKLEESEAGLTFYFLMIPVLLLLVYEFVGRKVSELKPYFFWTAHLFMVGAFFVSIFFMIFANIHPVFLFIPLGVYIYSTLSVQKEWGKKLFLYCSFTILPIIISLFSAYYEMEQVLTIDYVFLMVSVIIAILWLLVSEIWKKRIDWYLIPQSILGQFLFISFSDSLSIVLVSFILYIVFTLYLLHRRNWVIFTIIPLLIATTYFMDYVEMLGKFNEIGFLLVVFFALQFFGKWSKRPLISLHTKPIEIDWYTMVSALYIFQLFIIISYDDSLWLKLLPALLLVYYLYSLISRFQSQLEKRIVKTMTAMSVLCPYYTLLSQLKLNVYIETELYSLPFIVLTIFFSRSTWKEYKKAMTLVQWIVLLIVTMIIVSDSLSSNTIYDAIIVGVLSLISILCGMQFRVKSYFFIGIGVLLLNVFLQTRPLWGNFPWWGYLIIAGLTLMGFASFNEWQKQKTDSGKQSFLKVKKEQFLKKFKDWD